MIYSNLNLNELTENVKYINEYQYFNPYFVKKDSLELMVEEYKTRYIRATSKNDLNETKKILNLYRIYKDLLTDNARVIINKLIGDTKLSKKFVLICDGSYYMNRIWSYVDTENKVFDIQVNVDYKLLEEKYIGGYQQFHLLPVKKQIDWVYNHFDTIYIQFNKDISVERIYEEVLDRDIEMEYFAHDMDYDEEM